jgi:5'-3' exoribonuclease 1
VLTQPQLEIFSKVKSFVLSHRNWDRTRAPSLDRLAMQNSFSARERKFIATLADDLRLNLAWDEYDEDDENLVVWRFPDSLSGADAAVVAIDADVDAEDEEEWVDEEEDEESRDAVDRVLKKYEKAPVMDDDDDAFEARYEQSLRDKMDEWKRGYYQVRSSVLPSEQIETSK